MLYRQAVSPEVWGDENRLVITKIHICSLGLQKLFHDLGRGARVLQFINWQTGTTYGRMTRNIVQVSEPWQLEVSAFHGHKC